MAGPMSTVLGDASTTLTNGGFESGDLTGWTTGSTNGTVEVLQMGNFDPSISPTEGGYFVLLSSHSGTENETLILEGVLRTGTIPDNFGDDPSDDLDENGYSDNDVASLEQTFVLPGTGTLSFDWSFLTCEGNEYDDFFMVTLNEIDILHGSVPEAEEYVSPFENVPPLDGNDYDVSSSGPTDESEFCDGRTDFQQFSYEISTPGTYTLVFLVADQADSSVDSGLLVDNVSLEAETCLDFSADPTVGSTPMEVQFTNETTCNCDSWRWDFGDGETSTEQNPMHIYDNPGPFTVSLTASGLECQNGTIVKEDYIHPYTVGVGGEAYPVSPASSYIAWVAIVAGMVTCIMVLWPKRETTGK